MLILLCKTQQDKHKTAYITLYDCKIITATVFLKKYGKSYIVNEVENALFLTLFTQCESTFTYFSLFILKMIHYTLVRIISPFAIV